MDMHAVGEAIMAHAFKTLEARLAGDSSAELDIGALNAALARLPDTPDEKLR